MLFRWLLAKMVHSLLVESTQGCARNEHARDAEDEFGCGLKTRNSRDVPMLTQMTVVSA